LSEFIGHWALVIGHWSLVIQTEKATERMAAKKLTVVISQHQGKPLADDPSGGQSK
jgi:hypothetical protein